MKPKIITAILLFFSAYSPLFFILAVKDYNFIGFYFKHPIPDITLIIISLISNVLLFIIVAKIKKGNMVVTIKQVRSRSLDIINYTIPYLFCAFDIDLSKPEDIITIGLFLLILMILTIKTQSIFLNPLLALRGYIFYDLEYEFDKKQYSTVVISKFDLRLEHRFYIRSLTRFLFFVTKEVKNNDNEN